MSLWKLPGIAVVAVAFVAGLAALGSVRGDDDKTDRKSTRLNSSH